ncbi:hypothetical protein ScPMuIL_013234 [Solemya velum]
MWLPRGKVLLVVTLLCAFYDVGYVHCKNEQNGRTSGDSEKLIGNSTDTQVPRNYYPYPGDVQVGCSELRAKRYLSDGYCTSTKPLMEVVCAGQCLPIKEENLPWWAEFVKYWARQKIRQYRCEEDITKRRKVRLRCENGETRTYRIKVVKSCKCKRYVKQQNDSRRRRRRRRRKGDRNVKNNSSNSYKP